MGPTPKVGLGYVRKLPVQETEHYLDNVAIVVSQSSVMEVAVMFKKKSSQDIRLSPASEEMDHPKTPIQETTSLPTKAAIPVASSQSSAITTGKPLQEANYDVAQSAMVI